MVAVVAILIVAAASLLLARIGVLKLRLPASLLRWSSWGLVAVFGLAALGNFAAPAESYAREWHVFFFGPLLLTLALLRGVVARSSFADGRQP